MIGNGCFLCRIDYREIHKWESINTLFHFLLYLKKKAASVSVLRRLLFVYITLFSKLIYIQPNS